MSNGRMRKGLAGRAGIAFTLLFTLVMTSQVQAGSVHPQTTVNKVKTITFEMPPCPIKANTVPPTKTPFTLWRHTNLGQPASVSGTLQVTDQTGSTVMLFQDTVVVQQTGVSYARTVKTIQHATWQLTFDKGCTKTDPYGSNNCQWAWGRPVTKAFQGALQEDITTGKLIGDFKVNGTTPMQFSCRVCGAPCTVAIPNEIELVYDIVWDRIIWDQVFTLFGLPRFSGD